MSKRAPAAPEGHLPNSEPEQRPLLRGSTEPFSAALDALAGLLAAVPASAAVLQASLMEPAEDLAGPAQIMGRATPTLALGSHFFCGLCKAAGAEAHQAPLPVWQLIICMAGRMVAAEPCWHRSRLCSARPSWLPAWLGHKPIPFGLVSGPASMQALL